MTTHPCPTGQTGLPAAHPTTRAVPDAAMAGHGTGPTIDLFGQPATDGWVVIDTETTGLDPAADRIIEIAAVCLAPDTTITLTWSTLIDPSIDHIGAGEIHGLTAEMLAHQPGFAAAWPQLADLLGRRTVIGHNPDFDLDMLDTELARAGRGPLERAGAVDTVLLARECLPGQSHRLADCCQALGIANPHAHSALHDAIATAKLFANLTGRSAGRRNRAPMRDTARVGRTGIPGWDGSKLRALRRARNMTQKDLAAALGIPDTSIPRWEHGAPPRAQTVKAIAEVLGIEIAELLTAQATLASLRVIQGLTQAQVAERTGVPASTLSAIERGVFSPNQHTVELLAQVYDVPVDAITEAVGYCAR